MTQPSIAVVVPNYNDIQHLPRCLRSVLEQSDGLQELIVIDDQSTDSSVTLIHSLIDGDPRAQLVVNPVNLGTNKTIAEGLRRVSSEYVVFLAANDFLLPGMLARARTCLARVPGAGLWSAMAWLVDEEDRPIRLHPSAVVALKDTYLPPEQCAVLAHRLGHWFTGTTVTYHRETLVAAGGFDPVYGAPADLFAALAVSGTRGAVFTPEPFAAIRIHQGSYSSRALADVPGIERMLECLALRAPKLAPRMFTPAFIARTVLRFRFASVRVAGDAGMDEVARRVTVGRRLALHCVRCLVPERWSTARAVFAFLVLRPFDMLPALWYRLFGWALVRLRLKIRGGGAP
jgi:glycosyltransferase involved in cell wall biosynthesis